MADLVIDIDDDTSAIQNTISPLVGISISVTENENPVIQTTITPTLEVLFPGKKGDPGEKGDPGGSLLSYPSGENLSGHRMVTLTDDMCFYADRTRLTDAHKVIGMTTGASVLGAMATIQTTGELVEPLWSWIMDTPIWLGENGLLTQSVPDSGFSMIIGFPITVTKIFIDIREPIFLA